MAELITTQEEKDAATYLEWDDESLGKLVRKLAVKLDDYKGFDAAKTAAVMSLLCTNALDANASETKTTLNGITHKGESMGDWEILVRRLDV